ncbi:MDR family NADP-dependent oxidoreductase [Nocardioides yefusunii]|uniref:MDR family NADP-dependent oxidoreductase n=1 Tax=Nocardioides yefusunii TaxID=2500546 RepID=A0ABW1QTZ5_9ACTN|nr:NADP-dependent oxidoreductase [Nocardioides yefusunii]
MSDASQVLSTADNAGEVTAVVLAAIPVGVPTAEDFRVTTLPAAELGEGQVRVETLDLSLDPYVRSTLGGRHLGDRMTDVGDVIPGKSVARVVESRSADRAVGDLVLADTGWTSSAVLAAATTTPVRVPAGVAPSAALGALGMPGLTAYAAHVRHIAPQPGETVLVASATGGVGAVAGALVKAAGARAVAIVGSAEKARVAVEELGYDAAVLRGDDLADQLQATCPDKVNAYLHMGDQATMDVVMEHLAIGARVSLIGVLDQSNGAAPTRVRAGAIMAARATLHGMVVYDHFDLVGEQVDVVGRLLTEGVMPLFEDRYVGLDQAPLAFSKMMGGLNVGKVVVQVRSA